MRLGVQDYNDALISHTIREPLPEYPCKQPDCEQPSVGFGLCGEHAGDEPDTFVLPEQWLRENVHPYPDDMAEPKRAWRELAVLLSTYPRSADLDAVITICENRSSAVPEQPRLDQLLRHARMMSDYEIARDFEYLLSAVESDDDRAKLEAYAKARKDAPGFQPVANKRLTPDNSHTSIPAKTLKKVYK